MAASAPHPTVRVWPNRNAIGLAAVLLAMAYAGASQNNGAAYLLCFVLASVASISAMHTWANVRGVTVSADPIAPVFAGDALHVPVALSSALHRDHFSILVGKSPSDAGVKLEIVPSAGAVRDRIHIPTKKRGRFMELSVAVESIFPLGFFTARKIVKVRQPYFVYPAPDGSLPLPNSEAPTTQPKGGLRIAGDDFGGVRAWLPGESQRHIDWKAASRGQPLLTKQWAGETDEILRLDWEALPALDVEARLSELARWIIRAEETGAQYGLRLPGQSVPPSRGDRHYHICLCALACLENPDSTDYGNGANGSLA